MKSKAQRNMELGEKLFQISEEYKDLVNIEFRITYKSQKENKK
jgi:hypothetical protein